MHSAHDVSTLLFRHLIHDLGIGQIVTNDQFNPFPFGVPTEYESDSGLRARISLARSAFSKTEVESAPNAESVTLDEFLLANKVCSEKDASGFGLWNGNPLVGYIINEAREILYQAFHRNGEPVITMGSIESRARFGPGASVGLGSKPPLLYFKVGDCRQTCTTDFIRSWYESSVAYNPLCEAAEMARKARRGRAEVMPFGNLTFVPKKYSQRRIVITEPSLNTYFQLGLGEVMNEVLVRSFGIDLSTQPGKNSRLARIGSETGEYATIDMKQSSDFISLAFTEWFLPPSVYRWVKILRTPVVRIPQGRGFRIEPLFMVSTMGNGFTFPLQTLIYASLVKAAYSVLDIHEEVNVFGDDIICHTRAFDALCRSLEACGFRVNMDKSYNVGKFRESCGTDYYDGVDVRGVYLKRYTRSQDLLSCYNRLAIWSAKHDIPLTGTLECILSLIRGVIPIVPPDEPDYAGIRLPKPPCEPGSDGIWQYYPYAPKISSLSFEFWEKYSVGGHLKTRAFKRWLGDLKRFCDGSVNEPALLKVLLAGGLRRDKISLRQKDAIEFRQVAAQTPRWGFTVDENYPSLGSPGFDRLQRIIEESILNYATTLVSVGE